MCLTVCLTKSTILLVWLGQTVNTMFVRLYASKDVIEGWFVSFDDLERQTFDGFIWTSKDTSSFEVCMDPSESFWSIDDPSTDFLILRHMQSVMGIYIPCMVHFTVRHFERYQLDIVSEPSLVESIFSLVKGCNRVHWNTRENFDISCVYLSLCSLCSHINYRFAF